MERSTGCRQSRREQGGFTLAEVLVACAVVSVGLVAVASGFGFGVDGVEAGRQQSTVVFLVTNQSATALTQPVRRRPCPPARGERRRVGADEGFVLPGATHLLHVQQPRVVAETLAAFFARHPLPTQ